MYRYSSNKVYGGESDYTEGKGNNLDTNSVGKNSWYHGLGGGGYGGGAGAFTEYDSYVPGPVAGGDGTVLIRYQVLE